MPLTAITESELKAFQDSFSKLNTNRSDILSDLRLLYSRFQLNEQNLVSLEFEFNKSRIEAEYASAKRALQGKLDVLKTQYKQIDNRISSVEQKLSRGIPEDLKLVNILIAEQEAIILEQEKLNADEAIIAQKVTELDVSYGKKLAQTDQNRSAKLAPIQSRFEQYDASLEKAQKSISLKVGLLSMVPILGLPLLLEVVLSKLDIPISLSKSENQLVVSHYIFLLALILTEVFLAKRVRNVIHTLLAIQQAKVKTQELMSLFSANIRNLEKLERNSK